jgi:pimeloyl-ACP methyl ester carboxylesterase
MGPSQGVPVLKKCSFSSFLFLLIVTVFGLIAGLHAAGPQGTVYQFSVPKKGSMIADPTYYCWVPAQLEKARSIIVHQHGCTREGDAQQMMTDLQWLSLAKQWNSVFIAPKLITGLPGSGSTTCSNWYTIANGSGQTFLDALDTLARRTGHAEIKSIPWALWGHSGGSIWITGMAAKYPERVAVGVAQSCGTEISNTPEVLKIPILHHNGKSDMCYNDTYFSNGRAKGALWAHAINPNPTWVTAPTAFPADVEGHAPHDLRMIAIPWIEAGLGMRLPDLAGEVQLRDMDTTHAWLGDKVSKTIGPAFLNAGNRLAACWLPNQAFAQKWLDYMINGTVTDSSPPPAPRNITGTYSNRQITLKWDADADLESGIKTFLIYRNGNLLTTLQYSTTTYFTQAKGFQRWQDGDQPAPTQPPNMTFNDNAVNDTGTFAYQISTVNWSDIPSLKSEILSLKKGQVTTGIRPQNILIKVVPRKPIVLFGTPKKWLKRNIPEAQKIFDLKGNRKI